MNNIFFFHSVVNGFHLRSNFLPVKTSRKQDEWNTHVQYSEGTKGRRCFLFFSLVSLGSFVSLSALGKVKGKSPYDERRLLEQNKKIQEANKAPEDFPNFIRKGKSPSSLSSYSFGNKANGYLLREMTAKSLSDDTDS